MADDPAGPGRYGAGPDVRRERDPDAAPRGCAPTAKAAATAQNKLATRLSPGESTALSGWPSWLVYFTAPVPAPRRT